MNQRAIKEITHMAHAKERLLHQQPHALVQLGRLDLAGGALLAKGGDIRKKVASLAEGKPAHAGLATRPSMWPHACLSLGLSAASLL